VTDVPFRFGLERVRELRVHDEDRAREEFAASLSRRVRGAAMLASAGELVEQARTVRRADAHASALSAQDFLAHQLWMERLERDRQGAELDLARHEAEVEARRQSLGHARQRREVLERLKERRAAEHAARAARREGAELDELALAMHRRRVAEAR
jgi:flagellar FliJ protein